MERLHRFPGVKHSETQKTIHIGVEANREIVSWSENKGGNLTLSPSSKMGFADLFTARKHSNINKQMLLKQLEKYQKKAKSGAKSRAK